MSLRSTYLRGSFDSIADCCAKVLQYQHFSAKVKTDENRDSQFSNIT